MKYFMSLIALSVCFFISWNTWCQEKKLITKDDFLKVFSQPPSDNTSPKLKLRSISVLPRKPPEITVHILFKFGSTVLADEFSQKQLQEAGKALSSDILSTYFFEIQGHTDDIGLEDFNMKLDTQGHLRYGRF